MFGWTPRMCWMRPDVLGYTLIRLGHSSQRTGLTGGSWLWSGLVRQWLVMSSTLRNTRRQGLHVGKAL